ncbi:hypothetical protein CRX72_17575 [Pantoea sp. BRM17]|nr:hypothetical protein CRX72_17575 [Pantoea sp. BRM17]
MDLPARSGAVRGGEQYYPPRSRALILDFSRVDFIDSSCLGALISILKSLNGGQLLLCALNSNIKSMFTLTRMDRVFTLCANREEALRVPHRQATISRCWSLNI